MSALVWMLLLGWPALGQGAPRAVISRMPPDYPELARKMHVEGTVEVEVTAMPDGSAAKVKAVAGHPLLMQAAETCVSRWRFVMMKTPQREKVSVVFSLE